MNKTEDLLARAQKVIPWSTQTNAKRPDPALSGFQPPFIEKAFGCKVCDTKGKWYIDYRSSLGPIILGHRHPAVEAAVRKQLDRGVLFSMAAPEEVYLAEQLVEMQEGVDQVRFEKTGNNANACAIRLARAFTGRDRIITCGYHGHSDWFSVGGGPADTRWPRGRNGVPHQLDDLVTSVPYGDLEALTRAFAHSQVAPAALIMVPYDWGPVISVDFVQAARKLCDASGTVLIFDQVLTGFRLAAGSAQAFFGVIPDLTTYAKAMANGYPLAAYGGRREIMAMLDHVMLTTTYAGEALSLAASLATLRVIQQEDVIASIWENGAVLLNGFKDIAKSHGAELAIVGQPPIFKLHFVGDENGSALKTVYKYLFERGIFASDPFILNYAHTPPMIQDTLEAFEYALKQWRQAGSDGL